MQRTPAYLFPNAVTESERQILLDYLATDDHRTDARPDVRSKHPRWDEPGWPQHIVAAAMERVLGPGYVSEEVTFRQDRIGLKLHTDDGSPENAIGKTFMLLLDAQPCAETVFFKNYWTRWHRWGAFFTKRPWHPYQYTLFGNNGVVKEVADIRELLHQCETAPESVQDFQVDDHFINMLRELIQKRGLPKLDHDAQDSGTGYTQPGLRLHDYSELSDYVPGQAFDSDVRDRYLAHIDAEDLEGLTLESVQQWQPGAAIVFDREQIHSSGSSHQQKSFITVFCHRPQP